jgi:hypothetical protein
VLLLQELLPSATLEDLWNMPADVTISLLCSKLRLRSAAAPAAAVAPRANETPIRGLGDLHRFQRSAAGIVSESAEGEAALAQLDMFMLRGGAAKQPSKE